MPIRKNAPMGFADVVLDDLCSTRPRPCHQGPIEGGASVCDVETSTRLSQGALPRLGEKRL